MMKVAFIPLDSKPNDAKDVANDPGDGDNDQKKTLHNPPKHVLIMNLLLLCLQHHLGLVQDVLDVEQLGRLHE